MAENMNFTPEKSASFVSQALTENQLSLQVCLLPTDGGNICSTHDFVIMRNQIFAMSLQMVYITQKIINAFQYFQVTALRRSSAGGTHIIMFSISFLYFAKYISVPNHLINLSILWETPTSIVVRQDLRASSHRQSSRAERLPLEGNLYIQVVGFGVTLCWLLVIRITQDYLRCKVGKGELTLL